MSAITFTCPPRASRRTLSTVGVGGEADGAVAFGRRVPWGCGEVRLNYLNAEVLCALSLDLDSLVRTHFYKMLKNFLKVCVDYGLKRGAYARIYHRRLFPNDIFSFVLLFKSNIGGVFEGAGLFEYIRSIPLIRLRIACLTSIRLHLFSTTHLSPWTHSLPIHISGSPHLSTHQRPPSSHRRHRWWMCTLFSRR